MKRFTSKEQITSLIGKFIADNKLFCVRVHDLEFLASRLVGTCEFHRVESVRRQAEDVRRQISWRETRLKNLGDKLSEFQTPQLPGVDNGDNSIPTS